MADTLTACPSVRPSAVEHVGKRRITRIDPVPTRCCKPRPSVSPASAVVACAWVDRPVALTGPTPPRESEQYLGSKLDCRSQIERRVQSGAAGAYLLWCSPLRTRRGGRRCHISSLPAQLSFFRLTSAHHRQPKFYRLHIGIGCKVAYCLP